MLNLNRRVTLKYLGVAAVAVPALTTAAFPALADPAEDLYVPLRYQNFKRGTIHSLDPKTRGLVVVFDNLGRVKMKASDMVVKTTTGYPGNAYSELKEGQTVDVHWFDYLDFLIAKTTPATTKRADAMVAEGARIESFPGSEHKVRLFKMTGMVVKADPEHSTVDIINASTGEPDAPAPNSGEVIRLPQIQTDAGRTALTTLKPGDNLTAVFSVQSAFTIAIIR
jgi:Cu/Ag efflux protein CusF